MSARHRSPASAAGTPRSIRADRRRSRLRSAFILTALSAVALLSAVPDTVEQHAAASHPAPARETAPAAKPVAPLAAALIELAAVPAIAASPARESEEADAGRRDPAAGPVSERKGVPIRVPALWALSSEPGSGTNLPPIGDYQPDHTDLEFDSRVLDAVEAGDALGLSVPERGTFEAVIERVGFNTNGDRFLRGHLAGQEDDYPVVITVGDTTVFANLVTPYGSYNIESSDEEGSGWIALDDLFDVLVDPAAADVLNPDAPDQAGEPGDELLAEGLDELES